MARAHRHESAASLHVSGPPARDQDGAVSVKSAVRYGFDAGTTAALDRGSA
jgi:hypothetical protein